MTGVFKFEKLCGTAHVVVIDNASPDIPLSLFQIIIPNFI